MTYLALTLWPLGEIARARLLAEEALAFAQITEHIATVAYARGHLCSLDLLCRDSGRLLQHAESLVALSREHGLRMWLAVGTFELGHARWRTGERQAGEAEMLAGIGRCREQELALELQLLEAAYAEAQSEMGRIESAVAILDGAFALSERTGQHWHDAELNRLRGNILLKRDPTNLAPAEEAFQTAIAIAREQKARSFELRAAMSMARLWRNQGKPQQASELLAPVYGWFTEGFDTLDLKEAKAPLDQLHA